MGRKRLNEKTGQDAAKYSLLLPLDLDSKLQELISLTPGGNMSNVLRVILQEHLPEHIERIRGGYTPTKKDVGKTHQEEQKNEPIRLVLDDLLKQALTHIAAQLGLCMESLIVTLINENLATLMERARVRCEQVNAIVEKAVLNENNHLGSKKC